MAFNQVLVQKMIASRKEERERHFIFVDKLIASDGIAYNAALKEYCPTCKNKCKYVIFPDWYHHNKLPVWVVLWLMCFGFP